MKKLLFTLLIISSLFWSCNPEMITIKRNEADNSTTYRLQTGYIIGRTGSLTLQPCGTINPEKVVRNNAVSYNLIVDAWTNDWLEIEQGRSLFLALDGRALSFEVDSASITKGVLTSQWGSYSEKAWYPVTSEDLKNIASKEKILFRIKGMKRELQGEFDTEGFKNFKEFVKLHVN
jgi:hypothetical protein